MKKKCLLSLFAVCFAVFSMVVVEEARAQNPDINKDGVVDCYDIDELSRRIALRCEPIQGVIPCGDWNRDGCEDKGYDSFFYTDPEPAGGGGDMATQLFICSVLTPGITYRFGDANCDGFVDVSDFNIWNSNRFGKGSWRQGDFNCDGFVDVSDFNIWLENALMN